MSSPTNSPRRPPISRSNTQKRLIPKDQVDGKAVLSIAKALPRSVRGVAVAHAGRFGEFGTESNDIPAAERGKRREERLRGIWNEQRAFTPDLELHQSNAMEARGREMRRRMGVGEWDAKQAQDTSRSAIIAASLLRGSEWKREEARLRKASKKQLPLLRGGPSADESEVAKEAAKAAGLDDGVYVSPRGQLLADKRRRLGAVLDVMDYYGVNRNGIRATTAEQRDKQKAIDAGLLQKPRLPYQTAQGRSPRPHHLRVSQTDMKTIFRQQHPKKLPLPSSNLKAPTPLPTNIRPEVPRLNLGRRSWRMLEEAEGDVVEEKREEKRSVSVSLSGAMLDEEMKRGRVRTKEASVPLALFPASSLGALWSHREELEHGRKVTLGSDQSVVTGRRESSSARLFAEVRASSLRRTLLSGGKASLQMLEDGARQVGKLAQELSLSPRVAAKVDRGDYRERANAIRRASLASGSVRRSSNDMGSIRRSSNQIGSIRRSSNQIGSIRRSSNQIGSIRRSSNQIGSIRRSSNASSSAASLRRLQLSSQQKVGPVVANLEHVPGQFRSALDEAVFSQTTLAELAVENSAASDIADIVDRRWPGKLPPKPEEGLVTASMDRTGVEAAIDVFRAVRAGGIGIQFGPPIAPPKDEGEAWAIQVHDRTASLRRIGLEHAAALVSKDADEHSKEKDRASSTTTSPTSTPQNTDTPLESLDITTLNMVRHAVRRDASVNEPAPSSPSVPLVSPPIDTVDAAYNLQKEEEDEGDTTPTTSPTNQTPSKPVVRQRRPSSPDLYLPMESRRPALAPAALPTLSEVQDEIRRRNESERAARLRASLRRRAEQSLFGTEADAPPPTPASPSRGPAASADVATAAVAASAKESRPWRPLAHERRRPGESVGDAFEAAKLRGEKRLESQLDLLGAERAETLRFRREALEEIVENFSGADAVNEDKHILRWFTELRRSRALASRIGRGRTWFGPLVEAAARGRPLDQGWTPAEERIVRPLRALASADQRPTREFLRDLLLTTNKQDLAHPQVQLLFALIRRLAGLSIHQWILLYAQHPQAPTPPAEAYLHHLHQLAHPESTKRPDSSTSSKSSSTSSKSSSPTSKSSSPTSKSPPPRQLSDAERTTDMIKKLQKVKLIASPLAPPPPPTPNSQRIIRALADRMIAVGSSHNRLFEPSAPSPPTTTSPSSTWSSKSLPSEPPTPRIATPPDAVRAADARKLLDQILGPRPKDNFDHSAPHPARVILESAHEKISPRVTFAARRIENQRTRKKSVVPPRLHPHAQIRYILHKHAVEASKNQ